jgi:hypothetical protein
MKQPVFPIELATVMSVKYPANAFDRARIQPRIMSVKLHAVPVTLPSPARNDTMITLSVALFPDARIARKGAAGILPQQATAPPHEAASVAQGKDTAQNHIGEAPCCTCNLAQPYMQNTQLHGPKGFECEKISLHARPTQPQRALACRSISYQVFKIAACRMTA